MKKHKSSVQKKSIRKRALAALMTILLTGSVLADSGFLYVKASEKESVKEQGHLTEGAEQKAGAAINEPVQEYQIVGFEALPEEIREQCLPVGAKETDIIFPDSLKVTVREVRIPDNEDKTSSPDTSSMDPEKEETEKEELDREEEKKEETEKEGSGKEEPEKEEPEKEETEELQKEESGEQSAEKEEPGKEEAGEDPEKVGLEDQNQNTEAEGITQASALWNRFMDAFRPVTVYAAETATTEETISGIQWVLNEEESDFTEFDGNRNGSVYVYDPVLPEADDDGKKLTTGENVELPSICVMVLEFQVSLMVNAGTYKLDELPFNNESDVVFNSSNRDIYNNAVLTGKFSDFTDKQGKDQKSSRKGIVIDGITLNLTIRDVTIDRYLSSDNKWEATDAAITLKNGAALNLTLEGSNYLEGATGGAGICVREGCTLRITGNSTGTLKAFGGKYYGGAAGIGANGTGWTSTGSSEVVQKLGSIIIEGGTIEAVGGTQSYGGGVSSSAAGIGGSCGGTSGSIEISGGRVTATGGDGAAGIGGGMAGWVSAITISGGTITATTPESQGQRHSAAIGAGYYAKTSGDYSCGIIKMTGGNIIANGNIGYGERWAYGSGNKLGSVEIGADVILTLNDGKIDPGTEEEITEYTFVFTIHDGRLSRTTAADVSMDGTEVARKVKTTVKKPGKAEITVKLMSGSLSGQKKFVITIDGNIYETDIDLTAGRIEYQKSIGTELYPVTLEFYDLAITQDLNISDVIIKQNGAVLETGQYYSSGKISKVRQNYGTMMLYLPEGKDNTEISVTASVLNQGSAIVQVERSVSATEKNTILMLKPQEITLSVGLLALEDGRARLDVTINYAGATLRYLECNEDGKPAAEEIREKGEGIPLTGASQEVTVSCGNVSEHHFYMVAELGGTVSRVQEISFSSSPSAELIKKGDTKGILYDSFSGALREAENNPGSTIKLLKDISLSETITCEKGTCTIDLNGKTITADYSDNKGYLFNIRSSASVTLTDSDGSGKFKGNNAEKKLFSVDGRLIIKGGIFEVDAGKIEASEAWIENGIFRNNITIKTQNVTGMLSGGTFEGNLTVNWGIEKALKRGYRYQSLTDDKILSDLPTKDISKVKVVSLPAIGGTVMLDGGTSWGDTLTATYTPASEQSGEKYLYTWYLEDEEGKVTKIGRLSGKEQPKESLTDRLPLASEKYVGKWIYCQAEAEGTSYSGSICSGKVKVLEKDITGKITGGAIEKYYTGKPVTLTQKDFNSKYIRCGNDMDPTLILGTDVEIVEDSYQNNIESSTDDVKASVIIRGIGNYRGEYVLTYKIVPKNIAAEATVSNENWTKQQVIVTAPAGYALYPKKNGAYDYEKEAGTGFAVEEESTSAEGTLVYYRLKADGDDAISAEKTVTVKIDRSAPDFSGEQDGITIENKTWKAFLKKITFGFYTRTADVTIRATDEASGVADYYYYVDNVENRETYQILSKEALDDCADRGDFKKDSDGKFSLDPDREQVIYAFAVDHAGNRSGYVCTDGLVMDTEAPGMKITEPDQKNGTLKDTEATIGVELSEDAVLLFFYCDKRFFSSMPGNYEKYVAAVKDYMMNSDPKYPQFIKSENGRWVPTVSENTDLFDGGRYQYHWAQVQVVDRKDQSLAQNEMAVVYRTEGKKGTNSIIVDADDVAGLKPDTNYTIWIAAVDPAGNVAEYDFDFTTARAMPVMEKPPVVSGIYGDSASQLKITRDGVAVYKGETVEGTWKVTDTGTTPLPFDGSTRCQVTFIPAESYGGQYESAVFSVSPTLEKKPVTVYIEDMSKVYGEALPEITCRIPLDEDGRTQLVLNDAVESITESLQLRTEAGERSPAGEYSFTVTSDNPKYEVVPKYFKTLADMAEPKERGMLTVTKAEVKPQQVEAAGELTYGGTLSDLEFGKAVFTDAGDNKVTVPGTIAWKYPDRKPEAGTYQAEYIFTPFAETDPSWENNYKPYEGTITIMVNKAKAKLLRVPVPGNMVYNPVLALHEGLLNEYAEKNGQIEDIEELWIYGTWRFVDEEVIRTCMQVGSKSYEIYFEPDAWNENHVKNYDYSDCRATVTITVTKAVPYISVQPATASAYSHGDYLYNQALTGTAICGNGRGEEGSGSSETRITVPGTFTFKTPQTQLSYVEGNGKEYEYIFTPQDTDSYETITGKVAVSVSKGTFPPLMPGSSQNVAYSCTKVKDVKLPQGWEWDAADMEKILMVGSAVTAKAIYSAADSSNYENGCVSIRIIRSDCEHLRTEVRNAKEATCIAEGNTGETWCLICQKLLSGGSRIPKDAGKHTDLTEIVIRKATTLADGLSLRECSACGYREEVTIPKLPDKNTGETTGRNDGSGSGGQSGGRNDNQGSGGQSDSQNGGQGSDRQPDSRNENRESGGVVAGGLLESNPATSAKPSVEKKELSVPSQAPADQEAPFIKGADGTEGWQMIEERTDGAAEGDTIHVDMNGATTVPGDIFDSIRGRDITLTFDLGGGIHWTVNGLDVTAQNMKDINFSVTIGAQAGKDIPVDVINNVTGDRYAMNLTLAYDGEFGLTAVLTVNMDAANAGLYANLFYYNTASGELEFMCAEKIDEAGNADLTFTHASDYTIVIDRKPMDGTEQEESAGLETEEKASRQSEEKASAQPAEKASADWKTAPIWLLTGSILLAAFAGIYVYKKKK